MAWDFSPPKKKTPAEYAKLRKQKAAEHKRFLLLRRADENSKLYPELFDRLRTPEFHAWYESVTGDPWDLTNEADINRIFSRLFFANAIEQRDKYPPPEKVALTFAALVGASASERRRIMVALATPKWANKARMKEIYAERRRISEETGQMYHVDHIIPIQGKYVCGLHCETNLRVITATENLRKHNAFSDVGESLKAA